MSLAALREGLSLLVAHPALWTAGVLGGLISGAYLFLVLSAGMFIGSRAAILLAAVVPFILAGFFSQVCSRDFSMAGFLSGGGRGYFRVLLPGIVIGCAALLTVGLIIVPLALVGMPIDPVMVSGVSMGVCVPFAFFSFFYDTAALCEGQKVFESIRRSATLVILHGWRAFAYYIESLMLVFVVSFFGLILWTSLLLDRLEPLASLNMTDPEQMITLAQFQGILGQDGILVTVAIGFVLVTFLLPVLLAWKVSFFREIAGAAPEEGDVQEGVYDEKGRWFKY